MYQSVIRQISLKVAGTTSPSLSIWRMIWRQPPRGLGDQPFPSGRLAGVPGGFAGEPAPCPSPVALLFASVRAWLRSSNLRCSKMAWARRI